MLNDLLYSLVIATTTPKIILGTKAALQAATTWLLILIPVGAGLFLGFHAFMKSLATDESVIASKNKLIKNVFIGAAIAETASGLITVFLNFYK